jgi:FkbM family methyltransferase
MFVPNPEMLFEWDVEHLKFMDHILCKNQFTYDFFDKMKIKSELVLTKFSSICKRYDNPEYNKKDRNLVGHFAGTAYFKNTYHVIKYWIENDGFRDTNPDIKLVVTKKFFVDNELEKKLKKYLSTLNFQKITSFYGKNVNGKQYMNIYMFEYLDNEIYDFITNKTSVMLCPSMIDGYGHYINEGRCKKAIILTLDAPPMNEFTDNQKQLIKVKDTQLINKIYINKWLYKNSGTVVSYIDPVSFSEKMMNIISLSDSEFDRLCEENYEGYVKDTAFFAKTLSDKIADFDEQIGDNKSTGGVLLANTQEFKVGDNYTKYPYSWTYYMSAYNNDTITRNKFKQGYMFGMKNSMVLNSFINKGDIVLDIGANLGAMTVPLSKMVGDKGIIHAFEPFKKTFELLKHNVNRNKCHNVILYNNAVGHANTTTTLSDTIHDTTADYKIVKKKISQDDKFNYGAIQLGLKGQKVKMITIDSLDLDRLDIMKVDVEGGEPLVFYGAMKSIAKFKPIILFEYNFQKVSEDMKKSMNLTDEIANFDIINYCAKLGYDTIYKTDREDFMIVPPNRKRVIADKMVQFRKIDRINLPGSNKFKLFGLIKIKWY